MNLIVIALAEEVSQSFLELHTKKIINNSEYYLNKNQTYAIVFTDVGKVNTTMRLTKALVDFKKIDHIFNIGTCGSVSEKYNIFDVCLVKQVQFLDFDLSVFGYKKNQYRKLDKVLELNTKLIENSLVKEMLTHNNAKVGTSDTFIHRENVKQFIENEDVDLAEMELMALAITAHHFQIPLTSVKIVSDAIHTKQPSVEEFKKNQAKFQIIISNFINKLF